MTYMYDIWSLEAMHKGKGTWTRAQNAKAMKAVPHERCEARGGGRALTIIAKPEYGRFVALCVGGTSDK